MYCVQSDRLSLFYLEQQEYLLLRLKVTIRNGSSAWLHICTRSIILQPIDRSQPLIRIKLYDQTVVQFLSHVSRQQFESIPKVADQIKIFVQTAKRNSEKGGELCSVFVLGAQRLQKANRQPISAYDTVSTSSCLVLKIDEPNAKIIEFLQIYDQLKKYLRCSDYRECIFVEKLINSRLTNLYVEQVTIQGIVICQIIIGQHEIHLRQIINGYEQLAIPLKSVRHVFKYRYLQQHTALELFLYNSQSVLLNFRQDGREAVYRKLLDICNNIEIITLQCMQQRWRDGIISNFRYLQYLNRLASRSLHDSSAYPIYPWLIHENNLGFHVNNRAMFRDLSKSVSQLNPHRLRRLKELSKQDPTTTNRVEPYCMFKNYLSTSAAVHYYLLRKYPEMIVRLQHNVVVLEERIFHNVERAYYSSLNGVADFKELVQDFYEQSGLQCLKNIHGLELGSTKDKKQIRDVEIPEWAENPQDYLDKMAQALESAYVSEKLHLWIDLIFGYKTLEANRKKYDNEYNPMCYEQNLPKKRNDAIIMQIKSFGQHPPTLFKQPHPSKSKGQKQSLGSSIDDNLHDQLDSFLDD